MRHAADGERVPRHEDLLVTTRPDSLLAGCEELFFSRIQKRVIGYRSGHPQMPMPVLEVRRLVDPVVRSHNRVLGWREERRNLLAAPHVELSLLVLAVGIERGVVAALRRLAPAQCPARGLGRRSGRPRVRAEAPRHRREAGAAARGGTESSRRAGWSVRVGAVTAEAAAELVVDTAFAHV